MSEDPAVPIPGAMSDPIDSGRVTLENAFEAMRPVRAADIFDTDLKRGDTGVKVEQVYGYLKQFGYFPNPDLARRYPMWRPGLAFDPPDPKAFDDTLETAVRLFQKSNGLEVTGRLDQATRTLMSSSRCGVPDFALPETAPSYVAQGNRWRGNTVSYSFSGYSPDITVAQARAALRGAFDRWGSVTPLSFPENPAGGDIRIGWYSGNHGDGSPFDGRSGVLAHCFYPPPNGGALAGDCHFDEAERWSVNTPPSGIDLHTVALHELGHGLGLSHSADRSAVMYAYYGGPRRELTADDTRGIQSIYGARFRWASLGGIIFDPVVAANADGRLEVFVRGSDGALWHIWQTAPNNGWSGWHSLGGVIVGKPAVGRNADGRLEVFARGSDGRLWHIWQTAPNNGWSAWASLGGLISNPVVASNADGRLEVFVQGSDGALWHIWQTAPSNGWSNWASLGGVLGSAVSVGRNRDGRLEVFVRGTDGRLWHIWQTAPNNGWSGWGSLGGVIEGRPAVGSNRDGRLEVFVRGSDTALWHIWQTAPSNGWSGWASLGGIVADPSVANNADGRLEVFVRGADNSLWHIWQTAPNNGWSGWSSLSGQIIGEPVPTRNRDGRLEVFVKGTDRSLWHTWQSAPNDGWT